MAERRVWDFGTRQRSRALLPGPSGSPARRARPPRPLQSVYEALRTSKPQAPANQVITLWKFKLDWVPHAPHTPQLQAKLYIRIVHRKPS